MQSTKKSAPTKKAGSKRQPAVKKASTKPSSTRKKVEAKPTSSVVAKPRKSATPAPSKKSASSTQKGSTRRGRTTKEVPSSGEVKVNINVQGNTPDLEGMNQKLRESIYEGWATIQPAPPNRNITLDPNVEFEAVLIDLVRTHREKSKGYGNGDDPFRNFYLVAIQEGITPLQACNTLLGKHQAFIANRNRDPWPFDSAAVIDAYGDRAVYAVISEALRRRQCDGHIAIPDVM